MAAATTDLEATGAQAAMVTAYAFAWRSTPPLLPLALAVSVVVLVLGWVRLPVALVLSAAVVFGPLGLTSVLTFPLGFYATLQTWYRGSHVARVRFGATNLAFIYYGWRYAFRGRGRPWGARTREERLAQNPSRMGVHPAEGMVLFASAVGR